MRAFVAAYTAWFAVMTAAFTGLVPLTGAPRWGVAIGVVGTVAAAWLSVVIRRDGRAKADPPSREDRP